MLQMRLPAVRFCVHMVHSNTYIQGLYVVDPVSVPMEWCIGVGSFVH